MPSDRNGPAGYWKVPASTLHLNEETALFQMPPAEDVRVDYQQQMHCSNDVRACWNSAPAL
ncbi:MAG: hypothetical protein IIB17_09330 [Chloroflexi bacterium]|nr:hypothetical protein [Chloroflexota bacterium]